MHIQQKLLMLCLAVDASVKNGNICSVRKCTSQPGVDWIPVFEMRLISKPVRPMLRYGSTSAVEKNQLTPKYDNINDLYCVYIHIYILFNDEQCFHHNVTIKF
jgi:hypothetical protein